MRIGCRWTEACRHLGPKRDEVWRADDPVAWSRPGRHTLETAVRRSCRPIGKDFESTEEIAQLLPARVLPHRKSMSFALPKTAGPAKHGTTRWRRSWFTL